MLPALDGSLPPGRGERRARVAIVDDSVVVRGLFGRWLAELPDIEVVGIYRNGLEALRQVASVRPDVIVLDIDMPEMDGITALPLLLEAVPQARVLVVSALTIRGADLTLKCLMRGASEYLPKPTSMAKVSTSPEFKAQLQARVRLLMQVVPEGAARGAAEMPVVSRSTSTVQATAHPGRVVSGRPDLIVIGASTGGPAAIAALLGPVAKQLAHVPVVIAQHMMPTFTMLFADHLRRHVRLEAVEVGGGEVLAAGRVHVIRGETNLAVVREGASFRLERVAGETGDLKPSVDLLFSSAAKAAGPGVLGLVLTGASSDGRAGAGDIVQHGGTVLVQSAESCVVPSMPQAVIEAGFASGGASLPELSRQLSLRLA